MAASAASRRLGEYLVAKDLVAIDDIRLLILEEEAEGIPLPRLLVESGLVERTDLIEAVAYVTGRDIPHDLDDEDERPRFGAAMRVSTVRHGGVGTGERADIDELLDRVLDEGGSDLHLTVGAPPCIRVEGRLRPLAEYGVLERGETRRLVYQLLDDRQREAFERDLELDTSHTAERARFRVNVFRQRDAVGAVLRVIPKAIRPLAELGLPPVVGQLAELPRGLVLVTGPTGSGKSTTLASLVDHVNATRAVHIITVEDPIEFLHTNQRAIVNQRQVGEDTHSFANALRHALRQDPDVVLVGELRDLETISMAVTAAETGHLVFGALHTQDAPQSIDRMIDVFPPHQQAQVRVQLAASLQAVVTQQLVPAATGGRALACEVLVGTPAVRALIREGKTHQLGSAMQSGARHGMVTMDQSLARLVQSGAVTMADAAELAVNADDLKRLAGPNVAVVR
ncbi:MAG: pilus retraction protein PilT [Acidimicrobiales bacterium]|nr:pilus retraction protein PilT [Acidimicrobiales bacterium]